MTDVNDFTDYTEGCHCGHSRSQHVTLGCGGTRTERDITALPAPVYDDQGDPFAWPSNWPPPGEVPTRTEPCECAGFSVSPSEPAEW